jgi:hypothetical protein
MQDRRTLIITFVGGLAANLSTVVFVGVALAFAHLGANGHSSVRQLLSTLVWAPIGLILIAYGNNVRQGRTWRPRRPPLVQEKGTGWYVIGLGSLLLLLSVLTLIGLASGIK